MDTRLAILGFELEEVARLIALMEAQGLDEMVYQEGDRYLRIRGPRSPKTSKTISRAAPEPAPAAQKAIAPRRDKKRGQKEAAPTAPALDQIALTSPMVGVFYRSSQPGQPSFVEVGQAVALKQPIGMIEAMKVFSVIEAEHAGIVAAIPAQDGKLVQAGEALVILRK